MHWHVRAFTLAFAAPDVADDEIELADQLLGPVDLRAATLDVRLAELLRDAGANTVLANQYAILRAEISTSGLAFAQAKLELALAFRHAIRDDEEGVNGSITRLRELTRADYYAYYVDLARFMAVLPLPTDSAAQWLDGEQPPVSVGARWWLTDAATCEQGGRSHGLDFSEASPPMLHFQPDASISRRKLMASIKAMRLFTGVYCSGEAAWAVACREYVSGTAPL